jgi:hypothetical protein
VGCTFTCGTIFCFFAGGAGATNAGAGSAGVTGTGAVVDGSVLGAGGAFGSGVASVEVAGFPAAASRAASACFSISLEAFAASTTLAGAVPEITAPGKGFNACGFAATASPAFTFWQTMSPSITSSGPTKFPAASSVRQFTSFVSWAHTRTGTAAKTDTNTSL